MDKFDIAVIGAGAAGMMCAAEAGRRGRRVVVLDHNRTAGEKIRISGGGRCNFTNLHCTPEAFLSQNPKFAISALSRYGPQDFLDLVARHSIGWHEKTLGQLFCDGSAQQIITMLLAEMAAAGVTLRLSCGVRAVRRSGAGFVVEHTSGRLNVASVVVASGGRSIPKMGASGIGHEIARSFGLPLVAPRPALVPLTFSNDDLGRLKPLAGLSVPAAITINNACFEEGLLFTHRGLSGPSILQASSYWREGQAISVDLLPGRSAHDVLRAQKQTHGARHAANALASVLPKRLAALVAADIPQNRTLADLDDATLARLAKALNDWRLTPSGTEGYRIAEVTLGGVSTAALQSRTLQARAVPGLYFIGEVVDVTGWLGGYNFQWAWSSGWAAGQVA